ncbi:hypothetical protein [Nocardia tengchongensis]|uniref:hypothetical protein n=1 Tax=Nocardia tengchongensis TaxID=2055889 RepID=UPI003620FD3C
MNTTNHTHHLRFRGAGTGIPAAPSGGSAPPGGGGYPFDSGATGCPQPGFG